MTLLEEKLRAKQFVVTAELTTFDGVDADQVRQRARMIAPYVNAINCTDNTGARVHLSSVACGALIVQMGLEPIVQLTCRDRNRIALQSDLLGAAALGIKNILCLTGDDVGAGDHPGAKPVFDLDSIQLLRLAKTMRDEKKYLSGRKIKTAPEFFIGAAENPFAPPLDYRSERLAKKIEAGAQFIQTQLVFDIGVFKEFMHRAREEGLTERVFILPGIGFLKSLKVAHFLRNKVPGVVLPEAFVERLRGVPENQHEAEGMEIWAELIEQVREIKGVAGVHLFSFGREDAVAEMCRRLKLTTHDLREGRPQAWRGDGGFTDLLDEKDVPKYDLRVEALGTLDEVSSALGIARANAPGEEARNTLVEIQRDMCYMMSEVAGHMNNGATEYIDSSRTEWLEARLQELQHAAPWVKGFIVPGDTPFGADLQLARAITRRAERQIAKLTHDRELKNPMILAYLNRLAYVLYALARVEEMRAGVAAPTMARGKRGGNG
jgi:methylenetetrahydrofolate reductase (NADH)